VLKLAGEEPEDLAQVASKVDGEMINLLEPVDRGEVEAKICQVVGDKHLKLEAMEEQVVMMEHQQEVMRLVEDMALEVKDSVAATDSKLVVVP